MISGLGPRRWCCRQPAVAVLLAAWAAAAPATTVSSERDGVVTSLTAEPLTGGVDIVVTTDSPVPLVGVERDAAGALVVQLPRFRIAPTVGRLTFADGLVTSAAAESRERARGALTRVRVATRVEAAYTIAQEGSSLRLRLWPRGAPPASVAGEAVLRERLGELERELTETRRLRALLTERVDALASENRLLTERFEQSTVRQQALGERVAEALADAAKSLQAQHLEKATLATRVRALEADLAASQAANLNLRSVLDTRTERDRLADERRGLAALERRRRDEQVARALAEATRKLRSLGDENADLIARLTHAERSTADPGRAELVRVPQHDGPDHLVQLAPTDTAQGEAVPVVGAPDRMSPDEDGPREPTTDPRARERWTTTSLNLRRGPGMRFQRFDVLPPATRVVVIAEENGWLAVRVGDREGWLAGRFVQPGGPETAQP